MYLVKLTKIEQVILILLVLNEEIMTYSFNNYF